MKDMKALMNEWRSYEKKVLNEKANPAEVDPNRFPKGLSQVDAETAKTVTKTGPDNVDQGSEDDVIPVNTSGKWRAKDLKPSQNSMNLGKAAWFALGMANGTMFGSGGPGGQLGAFVSSDNYMMDGHHRWAATSMIKPEAPIAGYAVDFPGKELVRILNTITKGLLGVNQGKAGKGSFKSFRDINAVTQTLANLAKDEQDNGKGKAFTGVAGAMTPGKALEVMEAETGQKGDAAVKAMAKIMVANVGKVPGMSDSAVMPGASARPDMPVIDDQDGPVQPASKIAIKAMTTGQIDVNPPYGKSGAPQEEK